MHQGQKSQGRRRTEITLSLQPLITMTIHDVNEAASVTVDVGTEQKIPGAQQSRTMRTTAELLGRSRSEELRLSSSLRMTIFQPYHHSCLMNHQLDKDPTA